jgi:hypothetical protein
MPNRADPTNPPAHRTTTVIKTSRMVRIRAEVLTVIGLIRTVFWGAGCLELTRPMYRRAQGWKGRPKVRPCEAPLEDWEDEFIKRLKRFVEWVGRYPIPNAQKNAAEVNQNAMSTGDPEKFDRLFKRLQSILQTP